MFFNYIVIMLSLLGVTWMRALQLAEFLPGKGLFIALPLIAGFVIICFKYLIIYGIIKRMKKRCDKLLNERNNQI